MIEKVNKQDTADIELVKSLEKVDWKKYLEYGSVKLQIREGKLTLITIERTFKVD